MTLETHITIAYSVGLIATAVAYMYGFSCGITAMNKQMDQMDQMNNKLYNILEIINDHTNTSHKEDNEYNE